MLTKFQNVIKINKYSSINFLNFKFLYVKIMFKRCCERTNTHTWVMPLGSTPQPNKPEAKIWESPPGLGLGTQLSLLSLFIHRSTH